MTTGTRRRDAARHLAGSHSLREAAQVLRQTTFANSLLAAGQTVLALLITLPLFELSPWSHLTGFAALGVLAALFGRFAPPRRRSRIVALAALCLIAAVFVMSTLRLLGLPTLGQLAVLALGSGLFFFIAVTAKVGPPGALVFIFALGAAMSPVESLDQVIGRACTTAIAGLIALAICAATEGLRRGETDSRRFPPDPTRPLTHRLIAAARLALGTAVAGVLCHAFGAHYPAWAVMGAVAVMQGAHLHLNAHRALQRMAGTLAGAAIAWIVLDQDPSIWALIGIIAALQLATELVIGSNYGLGQMFVTPMALLMVHLSAPGPATTGAQMVPERILDTALGVVIGLVIAILFSSLDDRRYLAERRATA